MSGFLRTLQRVGLVELDDKPSAAQSTQEENESELAAEIQKRAEAPADEAPATQKPPPLVQLRELAAVYNDHSIEESPFPAEKLIKLLTGLGEMPVEMRMRAVMAMDAAEDDWTIQDALLDAKRKIAAIKAEQSRLTTGANARQKHSVQQIKERQEQKEKTAAQIREKIMKLEQDLETELEAAASECAEFRQAADSALQAAEQANLQHAREISQLAKLGAMFASQAKPTTSS